MREVCSDAELTHARAAVELVRGITTEARCRALLGDGRIVEAYLECIVLEQTMRVLERLPLTDADAAFRSGLQARFAELAENVYSPSSRRCGDSPPRNATG